MTEQTTHEPSPYETAISIADQLGETDEGVRKQIQNIVWTLGRTQACALLNETLQIEDGGGMLLPDGSRRRTPGGVFFHLVYSKGQPKEGRVLRRPSFKKPATKTPKETKPEPVIIAFTWDDRLAVIQEAEKTKGTANVKITLVGKPGKIVDQGQCVVTVMESTKVPSLPKGLPTPPSVATKYTVYIGSKQWKKVAEAIGDPEDVLIIEGFPTLDPQACAIAVFATNTTTKKLQMASKSKRQESTTA